MKKKTARIKKTAAKKTTRRTSRSSSETLLLPFSFKRIVFISTCLLLFVVIAVSSHKSAVRSSVAGISVMQGLFAQQVVELPAVDGVVSYNIYFKKTDASTYTNAVRSIPSSFKQYTISYLNKNVSYDYKISAVNAQGSEFWWSEVKTFSASSSM